MKILNGRSHSTAYSNLTLARATWSSFGYEHPSLLSHGSRRRTNQQERENHVDQGKRRPTHSEILDRYSRRRVSPTIIPLQTIILYLSFSVVMFSEADISRNSPSPNRISGITLAIRLHEIGFNDFTVSLPLPTRSKYNLLIPK